MFDLEAMRDQARTYRAAAATAPNRKIYELLLELTAEFDNAAAKAEMQSTSPKGGPSTARSGSE
jgi:hypothetical protein